MNEPDKERISNSPCRKTEISNCANANNPIPLYAQKGTRNNILEPCRSLNALWNHMKVLFYKMEL